MVLPAIKEQILNYLDRLSPEQQRRAAKLVHELTSPLPRGTAGKDLLRFSGTLDDASAREMLDAINEGCGRIDLDEW